MPGGAFVDAHIMIPTTSTAPTTGTAASTDSRRSDVRLAASLSLALLAAAITACGDASGDTVVTDAAPATSTAPSVERSTANEQVGPILPTGTHVGIARFAPPTPGAEAIYAERWDEANAGATIGRVLTDWTDVEPEEGVYDFADLEEQLEEISARGARPMVTIAAVDVSGTEFPAWLGAFQPERAAAAYTRMLERAAPMFAEHDVFLVAIANEPPLGDGLDVGEFADFVAAVETGADAVIPDIPVTFVFAGGDALRRDADTQRLAGAVDVFSVNHYCLGTDLLAIDLADTAEHLSAAIGLAGDKPVVFQEFGCPASEALGSSEEFQSEWFEEAFRLIRADDQIVAAYVFELANWSDELIDLDYGEAIAAEPELGWFFERLAEWLRTSGLIRQDASTRPSWDVYLSNLGG